MIVSNCRATITFWLFALLVASSTIETTAFQSHFGIHSHRPIRCGVDVDRSALRADKDSADKQDRSHDQISSSPRRRFSRSRPLRNFLSRFQGLSPKKYGPLKSFLLPLAISTAAVFAVKPEVTHAANAPVMAMPKAEGRDPMTEVLTERDRRMQRKAQEELQSFNAQARQIEAEKGENARIQFEKEYKAQKAQEAQAKVEGLADLKKNLLLQGICPFVDMEGQRQVLLFEKGVDMAKVQGTAFHLENQFQTKNPKKSFAFKKAPNREIIKCMAQDMVNRGIDPVGYFEGHTDKTQSILDMPAQQAIGLVQKYQENLDLYGQIVPPKEGEMSAKEKLALQQATSKDSKGEAKRLKAEAKAKAAAEKAELKAKVAAEKAAAKQAKADEKAAKKAAKTAAAAAAVAGAAAAASSQVASAAADTISSSAPEIPTPSTSGAEVSAPQVGNGDNDIGDSVEPESKYIETPSKQVKTKSSLPIVKASAVLVAAGGGGYMVKIYRDKAAADEEERQRQFRLLMGEAVDSDDSSSSPLDMDETEDDSADFTFDDEKHREDDISASSAPAAQELPVAPKKKKKRMFGKKKSDRETDITQLVIPGPGVNAPEFAKLLAKILTFGAPGRFPDVVALPGDMPMQSFDLDAANKILIEAQSSAGLTKEESAEVFANVVNCMLIDIVDLASSSLREKDDKATVNAIGIVVDFMNHAASLYESVAGDVVITPVTYGGELGNSKLEQMYSAYAVSGMTGSLENTHEDFQNRVNLLQDVFQIGDKKAEGLMMKALQKNMMEMMKSGEGMEGMEDMMKSFGGAGGMEGMMGLGEGEEPNPEQLKEMLLNLKELKEAGAIPPKEMEEVKKQFKQAFGSGVADVMKDAESSADDLTETDKELLELMKSILD